MPVNRPDTTDHQAQHAEELRPWFHDMYQFPFGRQSQVVHRPCGIVEPKPARGQDQRALVMSRPAAPAASSTSGRLPGPGYPVRGIASAVLSNVRPGSLG